MIVPGALLKKVVCGKENPGCMLYDIVYWLLISPFTQLAWRAKLHWCHLFPQTPYGISMEPDSKVTDKSECIFFETQHGHTRLVHLAEDDSHGDL